MPKWTSKTERNKAVAGVIDVGGRLVALMHTDAARKVVRAMNRDLRWAASLNTRPGNVTYEFVAFPVHEDRLGLQSRFSYSSYEEAMFFAKKLVAGYRRIFKKMLKQYAWQCELYKREQKRKFLNARTKFAKPLKPKLTMDRITIERVQRGVVQTVVGLKQG